MKFSQFLEQTTAGEDLLWHTTSLYGLYKILDQHVLKTKHDAFVSFSVRPLWTGDISYKQVAVGIKKSALASQVEKVEYSDEWFAKHYDQAAYVAGGGWSEQFHPPEWLYDPPEDWDEDRDGPYEPDEDEIENEYKAAELQSFLDKSNEDEWISKEAGDDVEFKPEDVVEIRISNASWAKNLRDFLSEHGYSAKVKVN